MARSPGASPIICSADGRLEVAGISGASAGAINAVMIADGLARGGPEEARKRLAAFWRAASAGGDLPPVQRAVADRLFSLAAVRDLAGAGLVRGDVALLLALRTQSAEHQSAARPDRPLRRFRRGARRRARTVHLDHQRAHRPHAHLPARQDRRRRGDGVGGAAAAVSRGRDRRRAALGRRLHEQSADVSVPADDGSRRHRHRADQPGAAQDDAAHLRRDRQPAERNHLQLGADRRDAQHGVRQPPDRRRPAVRRASAPTAIAASTSTASISAA